MTSIRALLDNLKAGKENARRIEKILFDKEKEKSKSKELGYLKKMAELFGFTIDATSLDEIEKYTVGASHGGIIALCSEREYPKLSKEHIVKNGFYVMIEGIEDPYNFGYALRSIYAAGVDGVILTGGVRTGSDGILARSSAGASERMPLFTADPADAVDLFKSKGYKIVSADLPDSVSVYEADLTKPLLLVIGGERRGITRSVLEKSDAIVRLDYGRPFEAALSAASAASILAFEVFRQNRG
jgi:23S rRNA (guanosine2251-2'-O)-methyltransferase